MSYDDKLNNFTLINDKNKVANYGDYYYHVMMVKSLEYGQYGKPFLTNGKKRIFINGLTPIISVYTGSSIANQYYFVNEKSTRDLSEYVNHIKVHIPYPTSSSTDTISTTETNCSSYDYSIINDIITYRKPHVSDMQILVTGDKLHIFMLVDVFSSYCPGSLGNAVEDRYGNWNRIVVYQQHTITDSGLNITPTPTLLSAFPMNLQSGPSGNLKYCRFNKTFISILSKSWSSNCYIYNNFENITDFHCGVIDSTHIYCLIGKSSGKLELYTAPTTYTDDVVWKYNTYYPRFNDYSIGYIPFNIYSHYVSNSCFYFSWSHWDGNKVVWKKIKSSNFNWQTRWKEFTEQSGNGLITYYSNLNFIWNGTKYYRMLDTTENSWPIMSYNKTIDSSSVNIKYRLNLVNLYPRINSFYYTLDLMGKILGSKESGTSYAFIYSINNSDIMLNLYNQISPPFPLILSIDKYYDGTDTINYYKFNGNLFGDKIEAKLTYNGTTYQVNPFKTNNKFYALPQSGNYNISWLLT